MSTQQKNANGRLAKSTRELITDLAEFFGSVCGSKQVDSNANPGYEEITIRNTAADVRDMVGSGAAAGLWHASFERARREAAQTFLEARIDVVEDQYDLLDY